jgi:hypothetical protein
MIEFAYFARVAWLVASIVGALFLSWLLVTALGDLKLRRAERNAPRTSVLLAWQRVSFDSALLFTMLIDVAISLVSFRPGMTAFVLLGLVVDKISIVLLTVYLAWNRRAVKEAGLREFNPARQTRRLVGSAVEGDRRDA